MVIKPQVAVISVRTSATAAETTAEKSQENLLGRQAESSAVQQRCEQILDILAVDLLPGDNIGTKSFLTNTVDPLPPVRNTGT